MKVRWQVRISKGWGCGIHTFWTLTAARAFIEQWRKGSDDADAGAMILRNGQQFE